MSDTAYMIVYALVGLYIGLMIGLSWAEKRAEAPKPLPSLQPLPLATPPSVENYTFQISLN